MVDFNNETTITTDRTKIVTVLILQRHDFVINALESFNKERFRVGGSFNKFKPDVMSAIISLWWQLRANMFEVSHPDFDRIDSLLSGSSLDDFLKAWVLLDSFVCSANLTRFYYKKGYSPRNTFDENEAKMS